MEARGSPALHSKSEEGKSDPKICIQGSQNSLRYLVNGYAVPSVSDSGEIVKDVL